MFFKMSNGRLRRACWAVCGLAAAWLLIGPGCSAQILDASAVALDHLPGGPAAPAAIHLQNGILTITADDSDLGDILQHVATLTGMTVQGLDGGQHSRVFGAYGPGRSDEVIASLLVGSTYNFILVGSGSAAGPSALLLSPRPAYSAPPPGPPNLQQDQPDPDSDEASPYIPDSLGPDAAERPPMRPESTTRQQRTLRRIQQMRAVDGNAPQ